MVLLYNILYIIQEFKVTVDAFYTMHVLYADWIVLQQNNYSWCYCDTCVCAWVVNWPKHEQFLIQAVTTLQYTCATFTWTWRTSWPGSEVSTWSQCWSSQTPIGIMREEKTGFIFYDIFLIFILIYKILYECSVIIVCIYYKFLLIRHRLICQTL